MFVQPAKTTMLVVLLLCASFGGAVFGAPVLAVTNQNSNVVSQYTIAGAFISNLTPAIAYNVPYSVAVGPTGNFYVTDYFNNRVVAFSATGIELTPLTDSALFRPRGLTTDDAGNVYVTNVNGNIVKFSGGTATLIGNVVDSRSIAYFGGNLYIDSSNTGNIISMNTSGGGVSNFANAVGSIFGQRGLAFDALGNLYLSDTNGGTNNGNIYKFAAGFNTPNTPPPAFITNLAGPNDLAVDRATGDIYVAEYFGNDIRRFSSAGSDLGAVVSNLSGPSGVAISADVPEPATLLLSAAALIGFGLLRSRRS